MSTVAQLEAELAAGRTTSRELVEQALARIADPSGEGSRAFLKVYAESALRHAALSDELRRSGLRRSPVDGLPVSLKDLFDVAGDVTRAGSRILEGAPPAVADAPAVARLRAAGAIFIGRTNMVEFAFGGVGLNAHYGTPRNPYDRQTGRVPGGSTSGGAVAQADGMCVMALGSDTRGSVRMPAALCGLTGFKPTARRVPREGVFPLSFTLDSVGPLANSVACCATYDAIVAGEAPAPLQEYPAKGLRLLLPRSSVLDDLDADVSRAFDAALRRLGAAGAIVADVPVPVFDRQADFFKAGGLAGAEVAYIHRAHFERLAEYDPRVGKRILFGKDMPATDYVALLEMRRALIAEVQALAAPYDAIVMPTTPCIAPTIAQAQESEEAYFRWNFRIMRNTGLVNFLDGCAVTLPIHEPGRAPVGFTVCGPAMSDRRILSVAATVERVLGRA